jgi:hypothetical protein
MRTLGFEKAKEKLALSCLMILKSNYLDLTDLQFKQIAYKLLANKGDRKDDGQISSCGFNISNWIGHSSIKGEFSHERTLKCLILHVNLHLNGKFMILAFVLVPS